MIKRRHIINHLINMYDYERYLEIGVSGGRTFNKINIKHKDGVDINNGNCNYKMSSDTFFAQNKDKNYDIIFIDGLHTAHQVYQDILNALICVADNGTIVVHDCNPMTEAQQTDNPPVGERSSWCGTGWKAILALRYSPANVVVRTVDTDYGCAIIQRGSRQIPDLPQERKMNFSLLKDYRQEILNLISVDDFFKIYR